MRSLVAAAAEGDLVVDGGGRHRADVVHLELYAAAAALAAADKPRLAKCHLKPSPRSLRLT